MSGISQSNNYNVRNILIDLASKLKPKDIGICLSAGLDSQSVCFALLEAGKNVHAYSFTLDNHNSRDFLMAQELSKLFGFKFTPIYLPTDIENLKKDVFRLHLDYGCEHKTEYECVWPFLYAYPVFAEQIIGTGIGADTQFCLSKRGVLHFKDNINAFREEGMNKKNPTEKKQHLKLCSEYNKTLFEPYRSAEIIEYFKDKTWYDCNLPKQKQIILNSFPEYFEKYRVYPHTSFQLGDSGIAKLFEQLLTTDLNVNKSVSVVGIYNNINKMKRGGGLF